MFNIPLWVYGLFFAILYIGIKRCYTRVIHIKRLILMPIIFSYFSIKGVMTLFDINSNTAFFLLAGIMIGLGIGFVQVKNCTIQADKSNKLMKIPGDFSMLIMMIVIFIMEFFIHYAADANLAIYKSPLFTFSAMVISGIVMGISIGRNTTYYHKYTYTLSTHISDLK